MATISVIDGPISSPSISSGVSPASRIASRDTSVQMPRVLSPSGERTGFISPMPVIAAARLRVTSVQVNALHHWRPLERSHGLQLLGNRIDFHSPRLPCTDAQERRRDIDDFYRHTCFASIGVETSTRPL